MKKHLTALFAACLLAVIAVGCGSETTLDSAKFDQAFASASGEIKTAADKVSSAIKSNDLRATLDSVAVVIAKSNELSQAQIDAANEVFVLANVIIAEKGQRQSASEAKSKADELANQPKSE